MLSIILTACVGTVEDGEEKKTDTSISKNTDVVFIGIEEAHGIADDKIEVFFLAAEGGSGQYDYYIYYGGGEVPIVVPSDVLTPDYRGLLKYTLDKLLPGTSFQIKIDVKDQVSKNETSTEKYAEAETFYNDVCDFGGISKVENLAGIDGIDSLKIFWSQPKSNSDGLLKNPLSDPNEFEIDLINTATYTPGDFDNDSLNGGAGRFFNSTPYDPSINSSIIRGLPSDTEFFIRVRCIHKNPITDVSKPFLYSELNTNYLRISTLSQDLASIIYNPDDVYILGGNGSDAGTFSLNWGQVNGVFDHYRIYYSEGTASFTDDCKLNVPSSGVYCKKASYQDTNIIINPLNDGSNYNVMFVLCQKPECNNPSERIVIKTLSYNTLPTAAPFLGIENIQFAEKVTELGSVYVSFTAPNLSQGYFDGFIVNYKDTPVSAPVEITAPAYSGGLSIENYDPLIVSKLKISNVPYYKNQCFNVGIFIYDALGNKIIYDNDVWTCAIPSILSPFKDEFVGLDDAVGTENLLNSSISLAWRKPLRGIYSEFVIYVRHTVGTFNYSEAKAAGLTNDTTNYWRISIPDGFTQYTLSFLGIGTYKIGMVTHHMDYTGSYFSENNENIAICPIATPPADGSTNVVPCSL